MSKWVNQFRSKVKKMLPHSRKRVLDETYDIKDTLGGYAFVIVMISFRFVFIDLVVEYSLW